MSDLEPTHELMRRIRKLEKNLQKIEKLEKHLDLNFEEKIKVNKKDTFRGELQRLKAQYKERETNENARTETTEKQRLISQGDGHEDPTRNNIQTEPQGSPRGSLNRAAEAQPDETQPDKAQPEQLQPEQPQAVEPETTELEPVVSQGTVPQTARESGSEAGCLGGSNTKVTASSGDQSADTTRHENSLRRRKRKSFEQKYCEVYQLVGHGDLVTSLQSVDSFIISASRDGTIKIWDQSTLECMRTLGAHRNSVNAVLILDKITPDAPKNSIVRLASGGEDSRLFIWNFHTGNIIYEKYLYNRIQCLAKITGYLVIGLSAGKIYLLNLIDYSLSQPYNVSGDTVTNITISVDEDIIFSTENNMIHIYRYDRDTSTLKSTYCSDPNLHVFDCIRTIQVLDEERLLVGDDQPNIHVLEWRTAGDGKEIANHEMADHERDFGIADSIIKIPQLGVIISSAFDVDRGEGFLNVTSLDGLRYMTSASKPDVKRIMCCHHVENCEQLTLVTGSEDLLIWKFNKIKSKQGFVCRRKEVKVRRKGEVTSSDSDLDEDSADDTNEPKTKSWIWSWCTIL